MLIIKSKILSLYCIRKLKKGKLNLNAEEITALLFKQSKTDLTSYPTP
ncbi:hypothetical protein T11_13865 [Trichinella zimbabwensis]|uniref:Uncharacterized protein n=1 Tax=Trichinella zimbabwensis TaxID=268475 RepID=A0A0V1GEA5_9BILA|nr:hypothetical protein T11_13865 [Trichinella zimbabwensis]